MATTPRLALRYPIGTDVDDVPTWMHNLALDLDAIIPPAGHGTLAARPVSSVGTPGIADRIYYATDVDPDTLVDRANVNGQLYRDNGTGWDPVGPFASKVNMGIFSAPSATGLQTISGVGFQPKLVKFTYVKTDLAALTQGQIGVGAMTPTVQYALMSRDNAETNVSYFWSELTCINFSVTGSGTTQWAAAYSAMLADGFRINWSVATASGPLRVAWEAWG